MICAIYIYCTIAHQECTYSKHKARKSIGFLFLRHSGCFTLSEGGHASIDPELCQISGGL